MKKKLVVLRRLSQGSFLSLFIYILWSTTYPLQGKLPPETFFQTDPLVIFITSISQRVLLPGFFLCLGMIMLTLILGRFFCGWVCPFGSVIDIAGAARKKTSEVRNRVNVLLRTPKFVILGSMLILAFLGIQAAWILDPLVIIARFVSLNLISSVTMGLDALFSGAIRAFHLYGAVYDIYRALKESLLGIHVVYFSHFWFTLLFFALIVGSALFLKRSWCRALCPLGAVYALIARFSFLRRAVAPCVNCKKCVKSCRMGAIKDDLSYTKGECVLCMDCVYDCPSGSTSFIFPFPVRIETIKIKKDSMQQGGISRKSFLVLAFISVLSTMGFKSKYSQGAQAARRANILRPPGVIDENRFLDRCIRCGNCMKVCITNGLQPLLFQEGLEGVWTPQLVPRIGYCEYHCTLCGNVCPTGAIPRLSVEEKKGARLGLAHIDQSLCLPWAKNEDCIVCQEHCPIADKAIQLKEEVVNGRVIKRPYVDPYLCVGCGICENKCPVEPRRAISVRPLTR